MNNSLLRTTRLLGAALRALLVLTVLTGILYPLAVTGVAQALFPGKANGSETEADGKVVGSSLIGQQGYSLRYFQPRPAHGPGRTRSTPGTGSSSPARPTWPPTARS